MFWCNKYYIVFGNSVYSANNGFTIYAVHEDTLIFYVKLGYMSFYNIKNELGNTISKALITQTSLYKDKKFKGNIQKLATYVFWNYILEFKGSVVTSNYQYQDGKAFWERRVNEALNQTNYYI